MLGSVNSIVESMFAADRVKGQQGSVNTQKSGSFSDYLNYALLNSQSGALFGNGSGVGMGYPYTGQLSGSIWQAFALKALADGVQKNSQSASGTKESPQQAKEDTDWAKIRVVRYYSSPAGHGQTAGKGILI